MSGTLAVEGKLAKAIVSIALVAAAVLAITKIYSPSVSIDQADVVQMPSHHAANQITKIKAGPPLANLVNPWSVVPRPDGSFLVGQRTNPGALSLITPKGQVIGVVGVPRSVGILDVVLAPDYSGTGRIYMSILEEDRNAVRFGRGAADPNLTPQRMAVIEAQLVVSGSTASLSNMRYIFTQSPWIVAMKGTGEPGGRIVFSQDGQFIFITSGDRQELDRDFLFSLDNNIGKIIRLYPDGRVPPDNPFFRLAGAKAEIWSLGHRNAYGLAFSPDGLLWSTEMGPMGGDEINVIEAGQNYGWPAVSNGSYYSGDPIPDHRPGDGFTAPKLDWTPVIAPTRLMVYKGSGFRSWDGTALVGGLQAEGIVRLRLERNTAVEIERINLGHRIRDICQKADGSLWVLYDGADGALVPIRPGT